MHWNAAAWHGLRGLRRLQTPSHHPTRHFLSNVFDLALRGSVHHRDPVRCLTLFQRSRCRYFSSNANSDARKPACGISFTSPWDVLGVDENASVDEIDSSYRRLIFKYHPDHGGTTEDFLRVKQAREVLVAKLDPDMELVGNSRRGSGGLRRKGFDKRFEEAVLAHDLEKAWSMWSLIMSGSQDIEVTAEITETYLQLLTKTSSEDRPVGDSGSHTDEIVLRWEGLLVSMDAFQQLRESGLLQAGGEEEAKAWNGLLWHLAQLPSGWSSMNDILIVCKRMDKLSIPQDLELLRTHIFVGRT